MDKGIEGVLKDLLEARERVRRVRRQAKQLERGEAGARAGMERIGREIEWEMGMIWEMIDEYEERALREEEKQENKKVK